MRKNDLQLDLLKFQIPKKQDSSDNPNQTQFFINPESRNIIRIGDHHLLLCLNLLHYDISSSNIDHVLFIADDAEKELGGCVRLCEPIDVSDVFVELFVNREGL